MVRRFNKTVTDGAGGDAVGAVLGAAPARRDALAAGAVAQRVHRLGDGAVGAAAALTPRLRRLEMKQ